LFIPTSTFIFSFSELFPSLLSPASSHEQRIPLSQSSQVFPTVDDGIDDGIRDMKETPGAEVSGIASKPHHSPFLIP